MSSGGTRLADWLGTLARYLYVADLIEHRAVVELGCGVGVGCEFLANHGAKSVLGVDRNESAISEARLRRALVNVDYRVGDYDALELEDSSVGLVLADGADCLRRPSVVLEIRRVLSRDGHLVWSSPSADRAGASRGASFHEFGDRLGELFGEHRMVAVQPLVAVCMAEYAEGEPAVELDTSLARLAHEPDPVTDYLAVFGPERTTPRPYTVLHLPGAEGLALAARSFGVAASDADRLRDELARERLGRHRAEALAGELKSRIADLERDSRTTSTPALDAAPGVAISTAVAAALDAHHAEVKRVEDELAEAREYVVELEGDDKQRREQLREAEAALSAEKGRVQTMRTQLGQWRDRTARAEGSALGLAVRLQEGDKPHGSDWAAPRRAVLEQLSRTEALLREQDAVVVEPNRGCAKLSKSASRPIQRGRAGEREHQLSSMAAQIGGRDAEITLLTVGLRSLRERLSAIADQLDSAMKSDSPERWREAAAGAAQLLRAFASP